MTATKKSKDTKKTARKTTSKKKSPVTLGKSRIEQYYSKIVAGFVLVTITLVVMIAYFSYSKTTIVITPQLVETTISFDTTLQDLDGVIVLTDVEGSKTYNDITSTEERSGKAHGTVTIINNYTQSQGLVATTRLLSESGVLFRTTETVNVPAGGSVDVPVEADEEGAAGDIDPTKFEIVALWEGIKNDIFGESSESMTGGVSSFGIVSQTDIANASAELRAELETTAKETFIEEVPRYEGLPDSPHLLDTVTVATVNKDEADVETGSEADQVTVTQNLTMAAAVVNADRLVEVLEAKLGDAVPAGVQLTEDISVDNATLTLSSMNDDFTNADVNVSIIAKTHITEQSEALNLANLTNRTQQEIETYLGAFDEVAAVDLQFSPFWMTKTPSLPENLTIRIEYPEGVSVSQ